MIQSVAEYFEGRRAEIDAHVQGEHKWLGDTNACTMMDSLCMHPDSIPWYHAREE